MIDLIHAKLDPASEFKRPNDILRERSLSREEKIDLLRRWAYEEREMAVAEEENMLSHDSNHGGDLLNQISNALLSLGIESDDENSPPTKQG